MLTSRAHVNAEREVILDALREYHGDGVQLTAAAPIWRDRRVILWRHAHPGHARNQRVRKYDARCHFAVTGAE